MSHYVVAVFTTENGKDVDELLAPYDEEVTLAPYISSTKWLTATFKKEWKINRCTYAY